MGASGANRTPQAPTPALPQREREENDQAVSENSSRPISMRRISLVPAPIS